MSNGLTPLSQTSGATDGYPVGNSTVSRRSGSSRERPLKRTTRSLSKDTRSRTKPSPSSKDRSCSKMLGSVSNQVLTSTVGSVGLWLGLVIPTRRSLGRTGRVNWPVRRIRTVLVGLVWVWVVLSHCLMGVLSRSPDGPHAREHTRILLARGSQSSCPLFGTDLRQGHRASTYGPASSLP